MCFEISKGSDEVISLKNIVKVSFISIVKLI